MSAASQQLKVEDALWYLERVKHQFGQQPQVYNQFLDIMKEFKSKAIDTPGVIKRVSHLFRGHPQLIVGFNTFLPPGYHIALDGVKVSISTPNGNSQFFLNEISAAQPQVVPQSFPQQQGQSSAQQVDLHGALLAHARPVQQGTVPMQASTTRITPPAFQVGPMQSQPTPQQLIPQPGAMQVVHSAQPFQPAQTYVEVHSAIAYVNKIKQRFANQPEIYKEFLDILHAYQRQQRNVKEGAVLPNQKILSESDVYRQVSQLFKGHDDLFTEFQRFLPEAVTTGSGTEETIASHRAASSSAVQPEEKRLTELKEDQRLSKPKRVSKRSGSPAAAEEKPRKSRRKQERESLPAMVIEAQKMAGYEEASLFDQIKRALKSDEVYNNFLHMISLFESKHMSKSDLLNMTSNTFLSKFPDLQAKLKDLMQCSGFDGYTEPIPATEGPQIRSDLAVEIDYATCKQCGTSYRKLPKTYKQPKASGRTELCDEVLNDEWVSFPSWSSEDTSTVSSKKTTFEEQVYKIEDERFELDNVIEINRSAIKIFESTWSRLKAKTLVDQQKFKLDECLGGSSAVLQQKAVRILYGDRADVILEGLRMAPLKAIPVVLKRLRQKDDEWCEARREFNRAWSESMDRSYLKSLDLQAATFKQQDQKLLRSKALQLHIEQLYDSRQELFEAGKVTPNGPHMEISFPAESSVFYDAMDLVIYHVRRQATMGREEKAGVKKLLRHALPDLFGLERCELSEDEDDDDESSQDSSGRASRLRNNRKSKKVKSDHGRKPKLPGTYSLMFSSNPWYVFLRMFCLLSQRLDAFRTRAKDLDVEQQARDADTSSPALAVLLKLKKEKEVPAKEYYSVLLDQVRNLLDGQVELGQFEDTVRDMYTIHAYVAFTMDKLIQAIVRQLQSIVIVDVKCKEMQRLYETFKKGLDEENYQRQAEMLLQNDNCYKIYFFHDSKHVTFELLDTDTDEEEKEKSPKTEPMETTSDDARDDLKVESSTDEAEPTSTTDEDGRASQTELISERCVEGLLDRVEETVNGEVGSGAPTSLATALLPLSVPSTLSSYAGHFVNDPAPTLLDLIGFRSAGSSPLFLRRNLRKLRGQLEEYLRRHPEESSEQRASVHDRVWLGHLENIAIRDIECGRFESGTKKYLIGRTAGEGSVSIDFFMCRPRSARKTAITAKEICQRRWANFSKFLENAPAAPNDDEKICFEGWMLGTSEGVAPRVERPVEAADVPPYRPYRRFICPPDSAGL